MNPTLTPTTPTTLPSPPDFDTVLTSQHFFFSSRRNRVINSSVRVTFQAQASICMRWWENKSVISSNMAEQSAPQLVDTLLRTGDRLVFLDFYSPRCGGCRTLHPKIKKFKDAMGKPDGPVEPGSGQGFGGIKDCENGGQWADSGERFIAAFTGVGRGGFNGEGVDEAG
ncbi:Thioredoxin-like 1-2, chloroplastic [Linum perenne]